MKAEDRPRFAQLMAGLIQSFRKDAPAALLDAYWTGLCDLELATVELAVGYCLKSSEFMPAAGELRRFCAEITRRQVEATRVPRLQPPPSEREKAAAVIRDWLKKNRAPGVPVAAQEGRE